MSNVVLAALAVAFLRALLALLCFETFWRYWIWWQQLYRHPSFQVVRYLLLWICLLQLALLIAVIWSFLTGDAVRRPGALARLVVVDTIIVLGSFYALLASWLFSRRFRTRVLRKIAARVAAALALAVALVALDLQ